MSTRSMDYIEAINHLPEGADFIEQSRTSGQTKAIAAFREWLRTR